MAFELKRFVVLVTVAALLAAPVAAQSLSVLLPSITFPGSAATPATTDCVPTAAMVCPTGK